MANGGRTRLQARRRAKDISQVEMARRTGLSRATYGRLEQGRFQNPPLRYLQNCAIVLGCELDDLIEDEWRTWLPIDGSQPPG